MKDNIFENKRGLYQLDPATGLFTIKDAPSTPKRFLGSVNPEALLNRGYSNEKIKLEDIQGDFRTEILILNLLQGYTSCFTPEFKLGYRPFGLTCHPNNIIFVGEHDLAFADEFRTRLQKKDKTIFFELGSVVTQVYRQLTEKERGYKVLS